MKTNHTKDEKQSECCVACKGIGGRAMMSWCERPDCKCHQPTNPTQISNKIVDNHSNVRGFEDKLDKLENVILSRVDPLFTDGTKILLKDYKETLLTHLITTERERGAREERERITEYVQKNAVVLGESVCVLASPLLGEIGITTSNHTTDK